MNKKKKMNIIQKCQKKAKNYNLEKFLAREPDEMRYLKNQLVD